jgi:hypothetical protein
MIVFLSPTNKNSGLASAVNYRIRADGSMIAAKSILWRLAGVGALCLMAGCGIGAALFGYSYVTDSRTSAEKMAAAFAAALDHANLGSVRLDPNATVKIDPSAVVRVVGDVPRPSERQLSGEASAAASNAKVVTNYTIFKQVPYADGKVDTGWTFSSSNQDMPDSQYCHYVGKTADGVTWQVVQLAVKAGQFLPASQNNNLNIDTALAFQQCIWFR